jgi:hypothetical protein
MSLLDYFFSGAGNGTGLSESEYNANKDRLDSQLASQGRSNVDNGSFDFLSPGNAGASAALNSLTFGLVGDPGNQPDGDNSSGLGALLKDLLVLAAIGGVIYLFLKLGGINQIKKIVS